MGCVNEFCFGNEKKKGTEGQKNATVNFSLKMIHCLYLIKTKGILIFIKSKIEIQNVMFIIIIIQIHITS